MLLHHKDRQWQIRVGCKILDHTLFVVAGRPLLPINKRFTTLVLCKQQSMTNKWDNLIDPPIEAVPRRILPSQVDRQCNVNCPLGCQCLACKGGLFTQASIAQPQDQRQR